jgi:hypothetical protein
MPALVSTQIAVILLGRCVSGLNDGVAVFLVAAKSTVQVADSVMNAQLGIWPKNTPRATPLPFTMSWLSVVHICSQEAVKLLDGTLLIIM